MLHDIGAWLEELELGKYREAFAENGVDFRALPYLTEDDLRELGVLLGHRRILLAAIGGVVSGLFICVTPQAATGCSGRRR